MSDGWTNVKRHCWSSWYGAFYGTLYTKPSPWAGFYYRKVVWDE